jgi:glycine C-acetyltransferase
MSSVRFICGT